MSALKVVRETSEDNMSAPNLPNSALIRSLNYRPYLKTVQRSMQLIAVFGLALLGYVVWNTPADLLIQYSMITGLFTFSVFFFLVARRIIDPLTYKTINIYENRIELESKDVCYPIQFSNIRTTMLHSLPFLGGWISIRLENGDTYRFSVALERSEYILNAITKFNKHLVDEDEIKNYRTTAVFMDHLWARIEDRYVARTITTLKYLAIPLFAYLVHNFEGSLNLQDRIIHLASGYLLPNFIIGITCIALLEFLVYIPRTKKSVEANDLMRKVNLEKQIELGKDLIHLLLFGIYLALT